MSNSDRNQALRISTAEMAMKMQRRFTEDDFITTVKFLNTGKSPAKYDKGLEIRKILNYFEYMAMFAKDGVIKQNYILHMHGHLLYILKTHPDAKREFDEWIKKNPKVYYIHLAELFKDVKE